MNEKLEKLGKEIEETEKKLRWLPPATPLCTCRSETPCVASCSRAASFVKIRYTSLYG